MEKLKKQENGERKLKKEKKKKKVGWKMGQINGFDCFANMWIKNFSQSSSSAAIYVLKTTVWLFQPRHHRIQRPKKKKKNVRGN